MSKTVKPSWSFPGISFLVAKVGFSLVFKISTRLEVLFETKYKKRQKDITYAII